MQPAHKAVRAERIVLAHIQDMTEAPHGLGRQAPQLSTRDGNILASALGDRA